MGAMIPPPPPFGVAAYPAPPSATGDIDGRDVLLRMHGRAINGTDCVAWIRVPLPRSWAQLCLHVAAQQARFWGTR